MLVRSMEREGSRLSVELGSDCEARRVFSVRAGLRSYFPIILPLFVFAVIFLALIFAPSSADWPSYAFFSALPYIIVTGSAVLGVSFGQSRMVFTSLLLAGITFAIQRTFFVAGDSGRGETVVFLAGLYYPPMAVVFYHLEERGLFSVHGRVRFAIVLSVLACLFILPAIVSVRSVVMSGSVLVRPVSSFLNISLSGLLMAVACAPLFFIPNRQEGPFMGPILAVALLHVEAGLGFRSSLWREGQQQAVLVSFMSGGAFCLLWAVLESSWRSAHIDELTGLPGRRALRHRLASMGRDFAIAVVDIDFFKKINDRHGHGTGDQVLRYVASILRRQTAGTAYRYGGEEFVIVYEGGEADAAEKAAEDVRRQVASGRFIVRGSDRPKERPAHAVRPSDLEERTLRITVSVGVAANSDRLQNAMEVLGAADRALYRAKKDGRNCTRIAR